MSLEFPFKYVLIPGLGKLFYPTIRLSIGTIFGWKEFTFLIDTGADVTVIPSDMLEFLDGNHKKGEILGVGGYRIPSYELRLRLKMGNDELSVVATAIPNHQGNTFPFLLGRKDIFEKKYSLHIDSRKQATIISRN